MSGDRSDDLLAAILGELVRIRTAVETIQTAAGSPPVIDSGWHRTVQAAAYLGMTPSGAPSAVVRPRARNLGPRPGGPAL